MRGCVIVRGMRGDWISTNRCDSDGPNSKRIVKWWEGMFEIDISCYANPPAPTSMFTCDPIFLSHSSIRPLRSTCSICTASVSLDDTPVRGGEGEQRVEGREEGRGQRVRVGMR